MRLGAVGFRAGILSVGLGAFVVGFATAGCSSGSEASKVNFVSQTSVFAGSALASSTANGGSVSGSITGTPGQSPSPPPFPGPAPAPTPGPGTGSVTGSITGSSIPVTRVCSDDLSSSWQNLKGALADLMTVEMLVNGVVCTSNAAIVRQFALQNNITISQLHQVCPSLVAANSNAANTLVQFQANGQPPYANCIVNSKCTPGTTTTSSTPYGGQFSWSSLSTPPPTAVVLWALNRNTTPANEAADSNCTTKHSPLVIRLSNAPGFTGSISLTSLSNGIFFDLLGARDNHQSVRIGWFAPPPSGYRLPYAFLALPNADGSVSGIDQLFGDSTLGPDGQMAANGYLALAKYDGMSADGLTRVAPADGFINATDAIFSHLRLWIDSNLDGVAQADELYPLSAHGIVSIDLNYLAGYDEIDPYGNETKYKSIVTFDNGGIDLIFDLWFVYQAQTGVN